MATTDTRRTVLITGCAPGGIGHELALEFHREGLNVFATARSSSTLTSLSSLGITTLSLDVTSPESVTSCLEKLTSHLSPTHPYLDLLVNNAGRNYTVPCMDLDMSEVEATFNANVFGVMRVTQVFMPLLLKAAEEKVKAGGEDPRVVMIGSLAGVLPYVFGGAYNATKAALHSYADTLRLEIEPFGVKVTTIITGGVQSRIARVERSLPEDSLYLPINPQYQRRLKHSQEGAMPTTAYAKSVVSHVLARRPKKWVWQGKKSWISWTVHQIFPKGIWAYIFPRMFGLDILKRLVYQQRREANIKKTI